MKNYVVLYLYNEGNLYNEEKTREFQVMGGSLVFVHPLVAHMSTFDQKGTRKSIFEVEGEHLTVEFVLAHGHEVDVPDVSLEQRVKFGVLCALAFGLCNHNSRWTEWAKGWLSGTDRTSESAKEAESSEVTRVHDRIAAASTEAGRCAARAARALNRGDEWVAIRDSVNAVKEYRNANQKNLSLLEELAQKAIS